MAELGIVTKTDGSYVELELQRSEACKHCNACLPSLTGKSMHIRAVNACGAKVGDRVLLNVQQNGFLSAVCLLYVLPAVVFVALILLLSLTSLNEWIVLILALVSVAVTYLLIHHFAPRLNQKRYTPVAEAILPDETKTHPMI